MIGFISEKLLIPILDFFYGLVPSYGLAIVALTVVIRIALFPLSAGSIRSARRMKIAQPVMQKRQAEIKSKFSGDPKRQQEELGKLMNESQATFEQISLAKRSSVSMASEVAIIARSILGGMGVTAEYPVMRHILNLEVLKTYQGTEEIHTLITGKSITGISAFRS